MCAAWCLVRSRACVRAVGPHRMCVEEGKGPVPFPLARGEWLSARPRPEPQPAGGLRVCGLGRSRRDPPGGVPRGGGYPMFLIKLKYFI